MAYDSNGLWKPENESVAGRVAALTSQDSPMMRQAAAQGLTAANRRGVSNSSIGIGAAQAAVIDRATPIASQDAQQSFGHNLQYDQNQQNDKQLAINSQLQANETYTQGIGQTLVNDKIPAATRSAAQSDIAGRYVAVSQSIRKLFPNLEGVSW